MTAKGEEEISAKVLEYDNQLQLSKAAYSRRNRNGCNSASASDSLEMRGTPLNATH